MRNPNIIYILADDMGYGDVRHLNPECKFPTPNLDRLGQEGIYFSDAHSSSAVCTPSRYSILTGRYCWRTYKKGGVLGGVSEPLIERERMTTASLLKNAGYHTACVGKWHVGWNWAAKPGTEGTFDRGNWGGDQQDWIDYTQPITDGPTECGFDYFYGISASLDMPPYVYVENDMPVEEPTAWGTNNEFCSPGPRMESLRANNVLSTITNKAIEYIEKQDSTQPFFLYFPLTAPHTPISPAPEFDGISGINPYADFCMEVDARVGQILAAVDNTGLTEDTLIIFTTDNGASCGPSECKALEEHYGHYCSHIYRGYKSDIWDGGHRVPFLMRWPAQIEPGTISAQAVGIFDLFATAADITGQAVPETAAEDSVSFLPALKGETIDESQRKALIHHSISGLFAIRKGKWKLCRCSGSGGWTEPKEETARDANLPPLQLYDMEQDPGELTNLASIEPDVVKEMTELLHACVVTGRSTEGPDQANAPEVPVTSWPQINWLQEIPEEYIRSD